MPNSASSNQNVNAIYQALQTLSAKVDTVLQGVEGRVAKVEMRMDRLEELHRLSTQWEVSEHKEIVEHMTNALQTTEHRIMDKLDQRDGDLKQTEIRLSNKIDEQQKQRMDEQKESWKERISGYITAFGWMIAIVLWILGEVLSRWPR